MNSESRAQAIVAASQKIPIVRTLRFELLEFGDGFCRMRVPKDDRYDGIYQSYHGGLLTTVADSIACFAIMTRTGPQQLMTTTDLHVRFLAPCLTDVTAEARVLKIGRTLCPVQVELFDAAGTMVAVAQVTYMLLEKMPARPTPGFEEWGSR